MNNIAWLKFLKHSKEAHHIREIFNGAFGCIEQEAVQKQFFDRIDFLLSGGIDIDEHTRKSLKNLREDIEDEIETGKMRGAAKASKAAKILQMPVVKRESRLEVALRAISNIRNELLRVERIVRDQLDDEEMEMQ